MAKKGYTLCAACAELTPSGGGFCRLCKNPLIQATPGKEEGHCPACGTLVKLAESLCYGCGWRLKVPTYLVAMIAVSMAALTFLTAVGMLGLTNRVRAEWYRIEQMERDRH